MVQVNRPFLVYYAAKLTNPRAVPREGRVCPGSWYSGRQNVLISKPVSYHYYPSCYKCKHMILTCFLIHHILLGTVKSYAIHCKK